MNLKKLIKLHTKVSYQAECNYKHNLYSYVYNMHADVHKAIAYSYGAISKVAFHSGADL